MLFNICLIILTSVTEILAQQEKEYPVNVGTVLFSAKDSEKRRWSKNEIALLQARKHFEKVLPPPGVYNNFDKDYIYNLLHYFKSAFSNIKKEDVDKHTSTILKRALSDALGGHLKVWVIPISKLNFYGGSVTREDLLNVFKFYDELKEYLGTDGDGWHGPDDVLMNNIKINVAPRIMTSFTGILKDPCGYLTFFEKTDSGLSIPLPHVNWDQRLSTMFVPLKNVSLIPMNSPDQGNALINYYDIAKRCIAVSNPVESELFEDKFQRWLDSEVIPHLKDDNMYYALDGVLTIANRTRALYNIALQQYSKNEHSLSATHIPFDITSKKMMIIFVILLLEVAWCVPALLYLLCTKKKRDYSKVYLFLNPRRKKDKFSFFRKENHKNLQIFSEFPPTRDLKDIETQRPSTLLELADANTSFTGHSYFRQDPVVSYTEFEAQCPSSRYAIAVGTGSRSYFTTKNKSTEAIVASTCKAPRKSLLKKTLDSQIRAIHTARVLPLSSQEKLRRLEQTEVVSINENTGKISPLRKLHNKENEKKTAIPQKRIERNKAIKSSSHIKHLEHSKDNKIIQQKRSEQTKYIKSNINNEKNNDLTSSKLVKTMPRCKIYTQSEPETQIMKAFETLLTRDSSEILKTTESDVTELEDPFHRQCPDEYPCYSDCTSNAKHDVATKLINNIVQVPGSKTMINKEPNPEERQSSSKTTRFKIFKERKFKNGPHDGSDIGKPLFEITIDRPATGICIDVSEDHKKLPKRSRIPKPRNNIPELVIEQTGDNKNVLNFNKKDKQKSLIPTLKRRTLDDIILTRVNCKSEVYCYNRLNDTI